MTLGDRLVVMHAGHAAQIATPMEIFERPGRHLCRRLHRQPRDELPRRPAGEGGRAVALDAGPLIRFADGPRPGPDGLR